MAQVGRPRGLIDYCTLDDAATEKAGGAARPVRQTLLRPRTIVYFSIWCALGAAMLFSLGQRPMLDLAVQPDRSPQNGRTSVWARGCPDVENAGGAVSLKKKKQET